MKMDSLALFDNVVSTGRRHLEENISYVGAHLQIAMLLLM